MSTSVKKNQKLKKEKTWAEKQPTWMAIGFPINH